MIITIDIETLPCNDPDLLAEIIAAVKPPGRMTKHETIAKWDAEERPQAEADAIAKTSLDGTYGRVAVIGWAIDDGEPSAIVSADEGSLIETVYAEIARAINPLDGHSHSATFVGHNITGFDFPFLRKRSYIHGIKPPPELYGALLAKSWSPLVADTMLMWDSDREKRISLDRLCRVLSIPSPKADGIDGSKVAELFQAGKYDELGAYCCADVEATRRCYRAMTFS